MASITVRNLGEDVKRRLAAQAKTHGRSTEAEVRDILTHNVCRPNIAVALMRSAQSVGGIDDLTVPPRDDVARVVDVD